MAIITKKTESPIAWGEIKEAVKAGKAAEILHVGDEIAETLTTGEQVVFVVAGKIGRAACWERVWTWV